MGLTQSRGGGTNTRRALWRLEEVILVRRLWMASLLVAASAVGGTIALANCTNSGSADACFTTSTQTSGNAVQVTSTLGSSCSAGYYLRTVDPGNGDAVQCDVRYY